MELSDSDSLPLHDVWLWVSVSICCQGKPHWWWLDKVLLYEYSLILWNHNNDYFLTNYISVVYPRSLAYLVFGSWLPSCLVLQSACSVCDGLRVAAPEQFQVLHLIKKYKHNHLDLAPKWWLRQRLRRARLLFWVLEVKNLILSKR